MVILQVQSLKWNNCGALKDFHIFPIILKLIMHNDSHMQKYQIETPYYQPLGPLSMYAVAQGLAQLFHKQEVVGSNPLLGTYDLSFPVSFCLPFFVVVSLFHAHTHSHTHNTHTPASTHWHTTAPPPSTLGIHVHTCICTTAYLHTFMDLTTPSPHRRTTHNHAHHTLTHTHTHTHTHTLVPEV